jgi:hypothetical protein
MGGGMSSNILFALLTAVVGDQGDATPACDRTAERTERKRR